MPVRVFLVLALGFLATTGHAALVTMDFVEARWFAASGLGRKFDTSTSTATWQYDTASQSLAQTGGTFNLTMKLAPASAVWTHSFTDLTLLDVYGGSASSFICTEGNYGVSENTNFCGGYKLGDNFIDESTATWGPGLAYSRTIGGDDDPTYAQWSVASYLYAGYHSVSWDGTTLVFGNARCLSDCSTMPSGLNNGNLFTLQVSPVPAPGGIWLLGTALGMVAWKRRRSA
jgi:hypothetical protein